MKAGSEAGVIPIAVGVYDESELVVTGVGGMLAKQGGLADVRRIEPGAAQVPVDVLLCDPVGRTVQIEEYLNTIAALTLAPVIAFSWSSSPSSVRRALAAGARGFVFKTVTATDLAAAVSAVCRGETVTPDPATLVGALSLESALSGREAEVLELICRGLSNMEIADQLYVSVNSVKTYVRQVYQKVGVTRRAQAVAWGLAHDF